MQVLPSDWQHLLPTLHIPAQVATVSVGSTRHSSALGKQRVYWKLELSNELVSQHVWPALQRTSLHVRFRLVEVSASMSHTAGVKGNGGGLGGEQTRSVPSADAMYQSPPTPARAPPGPLYRCTKLPALVCSRPAESSCMSAPTDASMDTSVATTLG